ncbi:hypothetical protein D3C87_89350 [compost metagenome]
MNVFSGEESVKQCVYILVSISLILGACAPKVVDRQFPVPKTSFGPKTGDPKLSLRIREFGEAAPDLSWEGKISTARYFEQAENLIRLGELMSQPAIKAKGLSWIKKFYQQEHAARWSPLEETPFTTLVGAQTQEEVRPALDEVLGQMELARPVIREHILALGNSTPGLSQNGLADVLQNAEAFTQRVFDEIPRMNLPLVIEEGLQEELLAQTEPLFVEVRELLSKIPQTTTLTQILDLVDQAILKFEVEMPKELQDSMKQGRKIARSLDRMRDAQGGLRVLIDIWETLTPEERAEYFKPVNETLYDFLSKQDKKELACLRTEGCNGGLFKGIAKKVFILPKIKEYGLTKLKNEMNQKTREFVLSAIEGFGVEFVKTMPESFAQQIDDGMVAKAGRIRNVQNDFISYIKLIFTRWSKKMLPETEGLLAGFEASVVDIKISNKDPMVLKPLESTLELDSETAGAALMASGHWLESLPAHSEEGFPLALAQINKLVAIGGYRNTVGGLVPPLLAPVAHQGRLLDIMNMSSSKDPQFSFRIPDKIPLQDAFHADPQMVYEKNFSVNSLTSQLRGLNQMIRFTADWKQSNFNHFLEPIKAQDVTQDAKDEALDRTLFPKDMLFALNLGNAAVLLEGMTKAATPVFLLTLENTLMWADKYGSDIPETVIMAGIVDIKNGQRSEIARTQDVAKFLLATAEFLEVTEGVEATKSPILLEKDSEGIKPLDTLIQGRKDLKLLVIALGNFISTQLLTEKSLVRSSYHLQTKTQTPLSTYMVEDQMFAIKALVKAWEITKIDPYLWSAKEIYFSMNKNLFNKNEEFYLNGDGSKIGFPEKISTLVAIAELFPHLPSESQLQLLKVSDPWIKAILELQ